MLTKLQLTRKAQGLRQKQVAKAVGISRPYLALLESKRRHPSPNVARKLAKVLRVHVDWLFADEVSV